MKKYITLTLFTIALIACKQETNTSDFDINTANIEQLRAKKQTVITTYDSIAAIIKTLDIAIAKKDTSKRLPAVTTLLVTPQPFKHYIEIQGNINTDQNVLIYPEFQGMLNKVYVQEGQQVKKGQLLATIADGGLSSQLAQAQAQADLALTTFERQERLWKQNIGSELQYLQAKNAMKSTKNAVKQIKSQLQRTRITAPFNGQIDNIITKQGQIVAPGALAIMRIVNLSKMYVEASVPENYLSTINKGSEVAIKIPSIGKSVNGRVNTIGNYINPNNRTFTIKVAIKNPDLSIKPNLMAKLAINDYANENSLLVPNTSIQENANGEKFIYKITKKGSKQIATKQQVQTGLNHKGKIEITKGLTAGDVIVDEGALTLLDGTEITVIKK